LNDGTLASNPSALNVSQPRRARAVWRDEMGLVVVYFLLCTYMAVRSPYFLSTHNFKNILVECSTIGLLSIGTTMVIITGGIDLSIGSVLAFTGVLLARLSHQIPISAAVASALGVGAAAGVFNGLLITRVGINPLIATLGSLSILRGLAFEYSNGLTQSVEGGLFDYLGHGTVLGVPLQVVVTLLLFMIVAWVMGWTVFGRSIYAIGGNAQASRLAGIPVRRLQMIVYTLCGLGAAVGAMFQISHLGVADPKATAEIELSVIAAVILGGTSLNGGKGTLFGTLLGVLIMGTLNNGLHLLDVSSFRQDVARGVVLLLAVTIDQIRQRWQGVR
jgi:ribose transport system permease protein